MKIVFTGGGTGGHFYPHIAIAESIHRIAAENRLIEPQLYFLAPEPFDEQSLFANNIAFVRIPAGRMRRYFTLKNLATPFIMLGGTIRAFFVLFRLFPDVIFSRGSYGSVPVVLAARLLGIPVMVHESDSKPSRAVLLAAKFAKRIAVSFESSIPYFPKKVRGNIALTGIPVRGLMTQPLPEGAKQELGLDPGVPTVFVIGGSSGSKRINEIVLEGLLDLTSFANVIHQTGKDNFPEVSARSRVVLGSGGNAGRYHAFPYLTLEPLRRAAGAADVVVSRAGSTAIAEISLWGKPSILVPIPESISHDQRTNAYAYARTGAAVVLEEENMTPHILMSEIKRITNPAVANVMSAAAQGFANPDAARLIAEELLRIGLSHQAPVKR
ncbi:MAG: UDP-N-acetylglucosamine--N-acetylmuramyl-(pentapeptide) pyrophosphoryl-undecaprenol [Candidatus Parcubacteria bacterium]|jgi:UDP-N-acetylglucosamine--N-acetylmuramyl-(pentapeptide) pyrophosphoryl-undecaprenol N-acetylglucosamine transferase|nr:UDP-N-acetylglucosamine--N-acetylmuramyl-(pentapeptide) pyrophosphoryl-undecaprenol [Candidatus Parcubacteria bacterium]